MINMYKQPIDKANRMVYIKCTKSSNTHDTRQQMRVSESVNVEGTDKPGYTKGEAM